MARPVKEIHLRLESLSELFNLPEVDLFSEYRNHLTGLEIAIVELRSLYRARPARLIISLPEDQVADPDAIAHQARRGIQRYCDQRIRYNRRGRKATTRDGVVALRIGLPVALVGLLMTIWAAHLDQPDETVKAVLDHLGWVLAWIGLWFPLDTILFTTDGFTQENTVLAHLRDAEIVIEPRAPSGYAVDPA